MANKFLNIGGGSVNLSNGSVSIYAQSLASKELQPSFPVKTDSLNKLVSEKLDISDVNNLQTALDNAGGDTTDLVTKTQNISLTGTDNSQTTISNRLNISGRLDCDGQITMTTTPTVSQSTFSSDQELVTKKYVDDSTGGGGSGIEVGTKSQLLAKTGMSEGDQFYVNANAGTAFTSQENKLWTYTGRTWQVIGETVELLAQVDVIEGNTVEISGSGSTSDFQFTKTNAAEDVHVIGVVALKGASAGDWATVATRGMWEVACDATSGQYDRSNYLTCNSTDGLANETTSVSAQPFAKILENRTISVDGGLVWALLHTAEIY